MGGWWQAADLRPQSSLSKEGEGQGVYWPTSTHVSSPVSAARSLEPHVPAQIWKAEFLASNRSLIKHGVQGESLIWS